LQNIISAIRSFCAQKPSFRSLHQHCCT